MKKGTLGDSALSESQERAFSYYQRLGRVRKFVETNYRHRISLSDVAEIAELETTYFSSYFHQKVGIRFREYLSLLRLRKAVELVRASDRTLPEVAREVGFGDYRAFERAVRKYTGMTPRKLQELERATVRSGKKKPVVGQERGRQ